MPNLRSLLSKIRASIRKRPSAPTPRVPKLKTRFPGHFGIHAISRAYREQRVRQGLPQFTEEEKAQWHEMPSETVQGFVYLGYTVPMHSSNVAAAKYDIDRHNLTIWFHGGNKQRVSEYLYNNVTEDEAIQFATYASKGGFTWDVLRIRGTRFGHRKPYRRVS